MTGYDPKRTTASAAVYRLSDRFLLHPLQRTTAGVWLASDPYANLPLDVASESLGSAALEALSLSGRTVPHPTSWEGLSTPRLKAAGVKSEKTFQTEALMVDLCRDDTGIQITPTRNGGAVGDSKGFDSLPEFKTSRPLNTDAASLGEAIRSSFTRCS
jgi:hypothetical protein